MRLFGVFLCVLLLAGCSLPLRPVEINSEQHESQLYHIKLSRWSEPRFSGLLALQASAEGLHYALLDATGVTLLSARVSAAGEHHLLQAYGPFQQSSLPEVLSHALFRIVQAEPNQLPCATNWLVRFCQRQKDGYFSKKASTGLATMWQVEYDQEQWTTASYSSPWIGFALQLTARKTVNLN